MTSPFITIAAAHYCLAVPLILHSHGYLPSDFATTSSGLNWGKYLFPYILMNVVLTLLPVVVYFTGNVMECFEEGLPPHPYKDALFAYVTVAIHLLSFTLHSCL